MNQFTSDFWSWYVIVLTLGSIAYCAFLLWKTSKAKAVAGRCRRRGARRQSRSS